MSLVHGACPPGLGIVGPIASVSSSKPLTTKPDAVNGFDLTGKVAVKCLEAEFHAYPSKFSRVTNCSMKSEGTTLAQFISAGARKRSLLLHHGSSSVEGREIDMSKEFTDAYCDLCEQIQEVMREELSGRFGGGDIVSTVCRLVLLTVYVPKVQELLPKATSTLHILKEYNQ